MIITDEKTLRIKSNLFDGTRLELSDLVTTLEIELENCGFPGVGLAAIQIGVPIQVGIIRTEKLYLDLINTTIVGGAGMKKMKEGCLSFPNQFIDVWRMKEIRLLNNGYEEYELSGFEAQAVQHEIDHFNGLTMFDRSA